MISPEAGLKLPPVMLSKGKESLSTDLKRSRSHPQQRNLPFTVSTLMVILSLVEASIWKGRLILVILGNRQFTIIKKRSKSQIEGVVPSVTVLSVASENFLIRMIII